MKKKSFAALLIVAPLALLAACSSTPSLVLKPNWFSDTGTKSIPDNFAETLEYAVSFEKSASAQNGRFSVDYPSGSYKTDFRSGIDGKRKTYVYTTELRMSVQYTLDGSQSELFEDVVKTEVVFLDTQNDLRPLSSRRDADIHAPLTTPSAGNISSLDKAFAHVQYRMETVYDYDNRKATFSVFNTESEDTIKNPEVKEINLDGNGLFFDNEQLIPIVRAAELSSSMAIYTIDPTTGTTEGLTVREGPTATTIRQSVKIGEAEAAELEFSATEISLGYAKQNSGGSHKITVANCLHPSSNTYRNVVLQYSYPIIYSLGTFTYRLTTANFYN